MARPQKNGIQYFPLDVDIFEDDKIKYVRGRFGEKGELLTIKLLCTIYREGYYTDWNEDKAIIFADGAGKSFSPSLANDIVAELVKRGFFDRSIFDSFGILTSIGIQSRYISAVAGRKNVNIHLDYWLIEAPEDTQKTSFLVSSSRNRVSPERNPENPERNTQTKVNNIKLNNINNPLYPPSGDRVENKPKKTSQAEQTRHELREIRKSFVFGAELEKAVNDWVKYKHERNQPYKPTGLRTLLSKIQSNALESGESQVIRVITESISSNYQGIVWDKINKKQLVSQASGNPFLDMLREGE